MKTNNKQKKIEKIPHLTPEKLLGGMFGKDTFNGINIAILGYCPRPDIMNKYNPKQVKDQNFILVPPSCVEICEFNGVRFLHIFHIYGGPVSASIIEELEYYGIKIVLAYGLAGGLGTFKQDLGDFYLVEKALASDGTTPHYTDKEIVYSSNILNSTIRELANSRNLKEMKSVQSFTSDAIYREYSENFDYARKKGCDIVNCDCGHLFAASNKVGILSTLCGVLSDITSSEEGKQKSSLSVMLSDTNTNKLNPLALTGEIVEFYIETLMDKIIATILPK